MKLTVKKGAVESATVLLARTISSKNALPILSCILCDVTDGNMRMTASDGEVTVTTIIPIEETEGGGRFCVNAQMLVNALNQLTDEVVTLTIDKENHTFKLQHATGEAFFPIENDETYPLPPVENYTTNIELNGASFREALKRSVWTTAQDDLRPQMTGVCLKATGDAVDIVASDGHSLVKNSLLNCPGVGEVEVILNKKAVNLLSVMLGDGSVLLQVNERMGKIQQGETTISFRLIEGKFPNYNSVIPKENPMKATVQRALLMNSIKKVIPFTADSSGSRMLHMLLEQGKLTLKGEDFDFSTGARDTISLDYNGDNFEIGVSGSLMLNIVSRMSCNDVNILMSAPARPILIEPAEQGEKEKVTMLAMPLMLK